MRGSTLFAYTLSERNLLMLKAQKANADLCDRNRVAHRVVHFAPNPTFFLPADSGHKSCTEGMEQYTAMKGTANTEMAWPKQRNELSTGTMLSLISRY